MNDMCVHLEVDADADADAALGFCACICVQACLHGSTCVCACVRGYMDAPARTLGMVNMPGWYGKRACRFQMERGQR